MFLCYRYIHPSHICVPDITKFIVKPGRTLLPKFYLRFLLSKDIPGYLRTWAKMDGHTIRIEKESVTKKFLMGNSTITMRTKNTRKMGIRGRGRRDGKREKWRRTLRENRAQKGL